MTNDLHQAYLSIGSNIQPEINLIKAINLLGNYGKIKALSSVWESQAIGAPGPNFLNACALFLTKLLADDLKEQIIHPIEITLGRVRTADKFAPRTIDIDIMMFDGNPINLERWIYPFVVIPMAELLPDVAYPLTHDRLSDAAENILRKTWMIERPDILEKTT